MKYLYSIMALFIVAGYSANAQDTQEDRPLTKDKKEILPEEGDIALGIQASPFLDYVGNFLNGNSNNNSPYFSGTNNTIFVKKFTSNTTAIRLSLNLSRYSSSRTYSDVRDDAAVTDPLSTAQVNDVVKSTNYNNIIGIGVEKRRGYGRLQGFYGASAFFGFGGNGYSYSYGNAMTSGNQTPTSYNSTNPSVRTLESNTKTLSLGVSPFIGVEYFIARKISFQGEIGWNISYNWENEATATYETILDGSRVEYTRNNGDDQITSFNYNYFGSSIGLFFHF